MKKLFAVVLALALVLSLCSAFAEGYSGELKVWVPEATVDFTNEQIEAFKAAYPEYADMTVNIEPMGEGDAAGKVITDVDSAADVFNFAQDQLARLVAAGALEVVEENNAATVAAENSENAVAAATMGDTLYAYPLTSDNTYFMYYDKSVVTDPTNLEAILADCEKAGKSFYMEINSGWYQTAFFFGAGCTLTYDSDDDGNLTACNADYASENGLKALKAMIALAKSPAFQNGSSISNATNVGAIVDGTWDSVAAQDLFGENYAAAPLPTVDGWQMSGFGGYKLLGVKPQEDEAKLAACDALAAWLSSGEVQLARFKAVGWGPSNLAAQADEAVASDPAQVAVAAQMAYTIPQGQYPGDYWSLATGLGDRIIGKEFDDADDDTLMGVLTEFQDTCASYVG